MVDRKSSTRECWLDVYALFSLARLYRGIAASFLLITCLQNDSPLRIYFVEKCHRNGTRSSETRNYSDVG